MSSPDQYRVGWCPGALKPMLSGDGLIVRVKPRGSRLTPAAAHGIADAALRYGNGELDLTSRANLQVRGVTEAGLPALTDTLQALGLLDPSAEAEAVRNVIGSPLAGADPSALLDIRPIVDALEARLVADPTLHALPPKFGFVIDDGGRFGLDDVAADVRFRAYLSDHGPRFRVVVSRDTDYPHPTIADAMATFSRGAGEGECAPGDLVDVAVAAALPFSRTAAEGGHRVSDGRMRGTTSPLAGLHAGNILGLAAPFGRLPAQALLRLAEAAAREGADLRLTPWRAVLVPAPDAAAAGRIAAVCDPAGWILDPADLRLRIAACPGAPGCRRGTTPVFDHATFLAGLLPRRPDGRAISVHVSGCGKGCAHRGEAAVTLVGHDGRYDLVLDGAAGSEPVARDLPFAEAAARVAVWARGGLRP